MSATPTDIARQAAQDLINARAIEQAVGENPLTALGYEFGDGDLTYESGMVALVTRAIEIDRAQRGTAEKESNMDKQPMNTWTCDCGQPMARYRGQTDQSCPECGQWFNAGGQRLRSDWAANPSALDEDVSDMDGFEIAHAGDDG